MFWPIPMPDLGEPLLDCHGLAVGTGGHVAVDQCIGQATGGGPELAEQVSREPSFGCFNGGAGMVGHQSAHQRVGALNVAEVSGPVERVETGIMQGRCVADVVQPRGRGHGVGVAGKDRGECLRRSCNSSRVRPAVWQRFFEQSPGECLG
jgi:hypothetical protein